MQLLEQKVKLNTITGSASPNSRVQVTPLARPVNRGVFRIHPVPSAVPISKAASGAPDADRWAALTSWRMPNRRTPHLSVTHGARHHRTSPDSQTSSGKKGSSRAVSSVAGSRTIKCVAYERSRCRIACHKVRTYAVARLWAIPACGKPHKTALGSVRNCRMAGRMMFILVVKRDAPVSSSCQIRRKYVRRAHPI